MIIAKEFMFHSAHFLPNYNGKCEKIHGHSYKLQVFVEDKVNSETGMIIDFYDFKKIVNEKIISVLDHVNLNDIIENPTTENIAVWIWDKLKNDLKICKITVWETPKSFVEYCGE